MYAALIEGLGMRTPRRVTWTVQREELPDGRTLSLLAPSVSVSGIGWVSARPPQPLSAHTDTAAVLAVCPALVDELILFRDCLERWHDGSDAAMSRLDIAVETLVLELRASGSLTA